MTDAPDHPAPHVVILGGAPGTGKTTLAVPLARALGVPLLAKDAIKERLLDAFDATDIAASQRVGGAGWELLYAMAGWLLDAGTGFVIEGNFDARAVPRLRDLARRAIAIQLICRCADEVSRARYARRAGSPDRHPGHFDLERLAQGARPGDAFGPFDLGIPTLDVDTTSDLRPTFDEIVRFARSTPGASQRGRATVPDAAGDRAPAGGSG